MAENNMLEERLTHYRIFIASPSGLDQERQVFRDVINSYNEMDAIERGVVFSPIEWDQTLRGVGRPQSLINTNLERCDYFVLVLHDRWGSPSGAKREGRELSGTEEEFYYALDCLNDKTKRMSQLLIFFKAVDAKRLADPGDQLKKVLSFCEKIERMKEHFFFTYDDITSFEEQIRVNLAHWVRTNERSRANKSKQTSNIVKTMKAEHLNRISNAFTACSINPADGSSEKLIEAENHARSGNLIKADVCFSEAVINKDINAYCRYGYFLRQSGRNRQAEELYKTMTNLNLPYKKEYQAEGFSQLSILSRQRGDLVASEGYCKKALDLFNESGHQDGVAKQLSSLAEISRIRGAWKRARELTMDAMEIETRLGRKEGLAYCLSRLGVIYRQENKFAESETSIREALRIYIEIENHEKAAFQYSNLGVVLRYLNKYDEAWNMCTKALNLVKEFNNNEELAKLYGSKACILVEMVKNHPEHIDKSTILTEQGINYYNGEKRNFYLSIALAFILNSIEINSGIGRKIGLAADYGVLSNIHLMKEDFYEAEMSIRMAMRINEQIDRLPGLAYDYRDLTKLYEMKGEFEKAQEMRTKEQEILAIIVNNNSTVLPYMQNDDLT